ncbi:hypothetical protein CEXT_505761 [Caerostris extrusa]|uniref:Uncharacterized protein n=1 Tax=Caerostris extrusa TaxID=172846 RepID=A0AAV4MLD4_CAEEX|nr:hypothetical protein CEXT_505761 [Caerostris extrusa]
MSMCGDGMDRSSQSRQIYLRHVENQEPRTQSNNSEIPLPQIIFVDLPDGAPAMQINTSLEEETQTRGPTRQTLTAAFKCRVFSPQIIHG